MNSKNIKNLVFGVTKEQGVEYLENLIGEIKYKDINKFSKSTFSFGLFVELKDGTTYQVAPATDAARGYKCDRVYVSKDIDKNILDNIIKPRLGVSKLPYEEQIVYF